MKSLSEVENKLDKDAVRLYDLIWKRTLASQMKSAKLKETTALINNQKAVFRASGRVILFPGYMRVYVVGSDNPDATIADKETLDYIGQIDIMNINWVSRSGTLGIVIADKDFHNRGIGTEATNLFLRYVFERANLHKVELDVHEFNSSGINCYKKCGFIQEGVIRESIYRDGKYYNTIKMGILKREFNK